LKHEQIEHYSIFLKPQVVYAGVIPVLAQIWKQDSWFHGI